MRLARHGSPGSERPIVAGSDQIWRDLSSVTDDGSGTFLRDGLPGLAESVASLPVVDEVGRFGPPLTGIGKIVCIGLNYDDHARETGAQRPAEPTVFLKTPDTVVGPDDEVLIPRNSTETDWEVELAVVIGAEARYLADASDAWACIAGYAISNDVS